jgi:hypothetical protein
MNLYQIEKNFLSANVLKEVIKNLELYDNWGDNIYAPERLIADIRNFSMLEDVYKQHFSMFSLLEHRIYFTRYTKGTRCLNHQDPTKFTVLIILKKASAGGEIKVGDKIFDTGPGDALLIRGSDDHEILTISEGERLSLAFGLY